MADRISSSELRRIKQIQEPLSGALAKKDPTFYADRALREIIRMRGISSEGKFLTPISSLRSVQRNTLTGYLTDAAEAYKRAKDSEHAEEFFKRAANYHPSGYDFQREILKLGEAEQVRNARAQRRNLEEYTSMPTAALTSSFAVISLLGALITVSMNMTGNAIGGSPSSNNWISIGLFLIGCALAVVYFILKRRNTGRIADSREKTEKKNKASKRKKRK